MSKKRMFVAGGPGTDTTSFCALGPEGVESAPLLDAYLQTQDTRSLVVWLVEVHGWEACRLSSISGDGFLGDIRVSLERREVPRP